MKNRWKGLLCALLLAVVTCSMLLLPSTAKAWKTKTHGFSANLLLEDAEDGKLTIDGTDYSIPDEYRIALKMHPDSFRAGVLGPDFYPDMLTGQSYIHPYDPDAGIGVGDWLKLLVEGVNNMMQDRDARYEALAFTLGMAVHYAGDMFGHDFINAFAGGAYPAYADAAQDEDKLFYIIRHMAEETYMDKLIGSRLGDTEVNAPDDFILATWIYNGSPNGGPAKIYDKYGGMMYQYVYLVEFRDKLHDFLDEYRDDTIMTPFVEVVAEWVDDLDTATEQLVATFDEIAHDFLTKPDDDSQSDVSIVKTRLNTWLNLYAAKATPFPDIMVDFVNRLSELSDEFLAATGIDKIMLPLRERLDELVEMALYGIFDAMGFDYSRYAYMTKDPHIALTEHGGTEADYNEYKSYMDLFRNNPESFDAFYNTLLMGKLILMGPDSLNSFFHKYGVSTSFGHTSARIMMDSFELTIHTKENPTIFETYGTDDNVILKVYNGNELLLKTFLDNPGRNVFENGREDRFKIGLPKKIYPENLRIELSTDRIRNDDWTLDKVSVRCFASGSPLYLFQIHVNETQDYIQTDSITLHTGDKKFDSESVVLSLSMPVNKMPLSYRQYTTALNLGIIDFMWSNDNSSQWVNDNNILWENNTARKNILYEVFHGFKPSISLKVQNATFDSQTHKYTFMTGSNAVLTVNFASRWNGITKERRDKEYKISSLNETAQKACTGPVLIEIQNDQGQAFAPLNGAAGNGVANISLSDLAPGTYELFAKYNGDLFNGKAVSDPIIVQVDGPSDGFHLVTYKIRGGKWENGETVDIIEQVRDNEKPKNIPTGMISTAGGSNGYWTPTDPHETDIIKDEVFTYTFPGVGNSKYNVTYKIVNGTWEDGSTDNITQIVHYWEAAGWWNGLIVPEGMKPFYGYGNGVWDIEPSYGNLNLDGGTTTFIYQFQTLERHKVTYKIVNGTWADGSTADKREFVPLGDTPSDVPYGMIADQGFKDGAWDIDPAMAIVTGPITLTYTFKAAPKHSVTYRIVNGTWADGSTDDITETVEDGKCPASVPVGMNPLSDRFADGSWDIYPADEPVLSTVTYTFTYKPIRTVTYKVVNGTWADGKTDDLTEDVVDGNTPSNFPSGMIPARGFSSGRWDTHPKGTVITGNRTFTWTFSVLPQYTVTYKIVNGTWADGSAGDMTESVYEGESPVSIPAGMIAAQGFRFGAWDIDPTGAVITGNKVFTWTFSVIPQYTVTYKIVNGTWADGTAGDITETVMEGENPARIPAGMIAAHGFKFGGWDIDPEGAVITENKAFTWTFSAAPQYTVTYKVVNGTWADGTSRNISESVIEGDFPAKVPAGMIADEGFSFGTWDRDPGTSVITKAETFIWTFEEETPVYTVTCGQDGWQKGSGIGLDFVVHRSVRDDLTFSRFRKLLLNGKELGTADANVRAGSLNVTVKASKLESLEPGSHTIKIEFADGEAELGFSVTPGKTTPKTGDSADLMLWAGMLLVGLTILGAGITCRRRRKARR